MDSEVYLQRRKSRKTLDSPTKDFFELEVEMTPEEDSINLKMQQEPEKNDAVDTNQTHSDHNVPDTTRVDSIDPSEFYYKTDLNKKESQSNVSQQFLSNFLLEFTDEELAAKRTVETIYSASSSFAYTYRSLEEAFFSRTNNFNTLMPFVKAIVSVADESVLLKELEMKRKNKEVTPTPTQDKSLLLNFELIMMGYFRPIKSKLNEFMSKKFPMSWKNLNEFITVLFKDGILMEFYNLFSNIYGIYEIYVDDFNRYMVDLRLYLTRLYEHLNVEEKKPKKQKKSNIYSLSDCVDIVNFLTLHLENMRNLFNLSVKNIVNTPETETLDKVLSPLEYELTTESLLKPESSEVLDKVTCIRMLLDEESLRFLGPSSIVSDTEFVRNKFNNFHTRYQEEMQRKSEESSEFMKKKKFKRDSVQYVLERLEEMGSGSLPSNCKNPFYTVGLAPKLCKQDSLKKYSRKLKTLLHPDTEHEAEWKEKAEKAFKEASLALDQCVKLIDTFSATLFKVGPQPPYLSHLGINVTEEAGYYNNERRTDQSSTATSTDKPTDKVSGNWSSSTTGGPKGQETSPPENLFLFFPDFSVHCHDQKVGSLSVEVNLVPVIESKIWNSMGKNKSVHLFVLRPLHSEPATIQVPPEMVSTVVTLYLSDSVKNKTPVLKVDAVQPIEFGSSWKYFVGLKISGDKGSTLVTWKSVFVELPSKGRTLSHITKMLNTFLNSSFVDQTLLQEKLRSIKSTGSKSEAESFLQECTKKAQKWTEEN